MGRQKYTEQIRRKKRFTLDGICQERSIYVNSVITYQRISRIWVLWEGAKRITGHSINSSVLAYQDLLSIAPSALEHSKLLGYPLCCKSNYSFPAVCSGLQVLKQHFCCSHKITLSFIVHNFQAFAITRSPIYERLLKYTYLFSSLSFQLL